MDLKLGRGKQIVLGIQHLFAMFGATVLVPALTGLNPSVALLAAGVGTILFHLCTKRMVPVFLGSSFAFIGAICTVMATSGVVYGETITNVTPEAIGNVQGGILVAGIVYLLLSLIVRFVGSERIRSFFPAVVTGPVIVVIGITLSPVAINGASGNWIVALITLLSVVVVSIFTKGFFKLVPILIGILVGFIASIISDVSFGTEIVSKTIFEGITVNPATWISPFWKFDGSFMTLPRFELSAIIAIAPVALVTFMEHIGDITTNGSVVGKDFFKEPGLHRTVLGDGIATMFAGLIGGPANTTYSENTGVLAVTKAYDPKLLRVAAVFAIILSLFRPLGAILQSIPGPVMGGVSILLFGMIASIGIRTMVESKVDLSKSRNLIVTSIILVFGLGMSGGLPVNIGEYSFTISGLFIAVVAGAIVNKILPKDI